MYSRDADNDRLVNKQTWRQMKQRQNKTKSKKSARTGNKTCRNTSRKQWNSPYSAHLPYEIHLALSAWRAMPALLQKGALYFANDACAEARTKDVLLIATSRNDVHACVRTRRIHL